MVLPRQALSHLHLRTLQVHLLAPPPSPGRRAPGAQLLLLTFQFTTETLKNTKRNSLKYECALNLETHGEAPHRGRELLCGMTGRAAGREVKQTALSFEITKGVLVSGPPEPPQQEGSSPSRPVLPESQDCFLRELGSGRRPRRSMGCLWAQTRSWVAGGWRPDGPGLGPAAHQPRHPSSAHLWFPINSSLTGQRRFSSSRYF